MLAATVTKNIEGDKVGLLNKMFAFFYQIRIVGKKIKAYNRTLYYILEYAIYVLLIYGIFF